MPKQQTQGRPVGAGRDEPEHSGPRALTRAFTLGVRAMEPDDRGERLEVAISSEAPVERYEWWTNERYVEVLDHSSEGPDLSYAKDGLPFLVDHDTKRQVGLLEEVRVDPDRVIRGTLRAGDHPDAAWVFRDMANGIRKKVSIGYFAGDNYEQSKAKKDEVPVRRYFNWMLYEGSSVSIPADYSVGVGRDARGVARPIRSPRDHSGETPTTKERTMDMDDNAPSGGAAHQPDEATRKALAAAERRERIMKRCEAAGVSLEQARKFQNSDLSVDEVSDELLRMKVEEQRPAVGSIGSGERADVTVGAERETEKPWESLTEFFRSTKAAATRGVVDPRLHGSRGIASGQGIGEGADGGFLVPEQYAQGIITRAFEGGRILSQLQSVPVSGNQYHVPLIDEKSRKNGSRFGNIQGYWIGENDAPTASKMKTRRVTLDLTKKAAVLAYVSEEQLQDAPATDAILSRGLEEEITFMVEQAVWEGTGVGQPLGIQNSGALVTVAKETGQAADTLVPANVTKMLARLWTGSQMNAAWFMHQTLLAVLPLMTIGERPVYLPPQGLASDGNLGTLLGRPMYTIEYAETLGNAGDLSLLDFSQYLFGQKARSAIARSVHVRFVEGEEAFRLVLRCDGIPMWNTALTPLKGTITTSPFVTLGERD